MVMDIDKLDEEVRRILSRKDGTRTYSEIREELIENGYSQQEMGYIMGIVDEKLLTSLDKGDQKKAAVRNMIIGAVMAIVALTVISASYFGSVAPKEVYYVSLVVFVVGYLVFRNGFRRRGAGNRGNEGSN
jgi:uncharacterized membrane protein YeaQ/YmgE (transglycosylase-associated protein family)